ncbi:hypothetical protein OESDEN_16659, partial [Oesophagostomum dentatum]
MSMRLSAEYVPLAGVHVWAITGTIRYRHHAELYYLENSAWDVLQGSRNAHTWSTLFAAWTQIVAQSLIAPVAWLFVVFLDGGYYRCLFAHNYCNLTTAVQCKNETVMEYYKSSHNFDKISGAGEYCPHCICNLEGEDASYLEAESQIYAWVILILFGVSTFL